ncbi:hypothetical protein DOTSEDRAFT_48471 [Dothistroma septosporum NZE10]|uniref:EGF-like domain-containing protein n=1 Tax=Dothistroma septosporum (strain NZE10 / CBS 128990) TaxID=675120 RepID=M2WJ95_DOTSN|nr:hypothetical protein DOTSEDRAFT_48471 [Dothistroma septosporum NZE10]
MTRPYYEDHSGGVPQHHPPDQQHHPQYPPPPPRHRPSGNNSSRILQPNHAAQDRRRNQPHMNPAYSTASPARGQRHYQDPYHPETSAWDASQNLYDGSGYGGPYEQHDQWPLPRQPSPPAHASPNVNSSPRKPPRRPQRPDESPLSENSRSSRESPRSTPRVPEQQYPPQASHHGSGQWTGDGYSYAAPLYPPPSRPLPPTSSSGQATIPQYVTPPVPQHPVYGQANRRPPLGPPPSARRGPPNYYPQVGPVHPIAEETDSMRGSFKTVSMRTGDHNSKTSFASSNAIPIGIPQFYVDDGSARPSTGERSIVTVGAASSRTDLGDGDEQYVEGATAHRFENFHVTEDEPERDQHSPVLVRQASLGKRSKPTLVTQKSGDQMPKSGDAIRKISDTAAVANSSSQRRAKRASKEPPPVAPAAIDTLHGIDAMHSRAIARDNSEAQAKPGAPDAEISVDDKQSRDALTLITGRDPSADHEIKPDDTRMRTPEELIRSGTGLLDASSDESADELRKRRSRELLGAAITNELYPEKVRTRSPLAPNEDERVKSILDSLEKGGAISSEEANELKKPMGGLSDRSNKRRPARLDVDAVRDAEARGSLTSLPDLIRRATTLASNLDRGKTASRLGMGHWLDGAPDAEKRRSGGISDMLNAFPTPNATSPASRTGWRNSRLRHSELLSDSDAGGPKKGGRRCCGMPRRVFILVMILLFLLVAAAIIVPVMLLVYVPDQNKDNNATNTVGRCDAALTCENGGANIFSSNGLCECLCVNGYTGPTCADQMPEGCTTTSIGSVSDATLGDAIPRLLKDSSSNFSVPLDGQALLGQFSQATLSCAEQNALVTFNNAASKRSFVDIAVHHDIKRQEPATTNGIIFATGTPTATVSPSASATSTATSSSADVDSTDAANNDVTLDFARVAVLYILQQSLNLDQAAKAQTALQASLSGNTVDGEAVNTQNISLGSGSSCNLVDYSIHLGNGTAVGGAGFTGGNSTASNITVS